MNAFKIATAYVASEWTGEVTMDSAANAEALVDWLAAHGWTGLIQEDGLTVEFGR
jgi:hypothetical protein